jgi:hypothetical protein
MPCEYTRNDARRIVRFTAVSPMTLADVTAALDRQLADGAWSFGMLVDIRRAILSITEARTLVEDIRERSRRHGPHGPLAMVTRDGVGTAQLYAMHSANLMPSPIEVFWDMPDAERWLEETQRRLHHE